MTLNKKLTVGLGFLFVLIFTMAIFCSYYIQKLSRESEDILRNNYDSIVFSKKMFLALDDMEISLSFMQFVPGKGGHKSGYYSNLFESGKAEFEKNLKAEDHNITEILEKDYVEDLKRNYAMFAKLSAQIVRGGGGNAVYFNEFLPVYEKLKHTINAINDVNMQAIVRKNQLTKRDSSAIIISMAVVGSICMILAFGYIWYFPFYISNSMSYLSNRMRELLKAIGIGQEIKTDDEFQVILQSLKLIEDNYSRKQKRKRKE
jgi:two-component system, NtrC family, sensor histidine kinase KinB